MLRLGHPGIVFRLHLSLARNVVAAEVLVRRQPGSGVLIRLRGIRGTIRGHKVQWIVGEFQTLLSAPLLRTLLPGIGQRNNVVDLNRCAGALAPLELNGLASVWVVESAGEYDALNLGGFELYVFQVPGKDVIARIAAIVVCVLPAIAELLAAVSSLWCTSLDLNVIQLVQSFRVRSLLIGRWGRCLSLARPGEVCWRRN